MRTSCFVYRSLTRAASAWSTPGSVCADDIDSGATASSRSEHRTRAERMAGMAREWLNERDACRPFDEGAVQSTGWASARERIRTLLEEGEAPQLQQERANTQPGGRIMRSITIRMLSIGVLVGSA